MSQVSNMLKWIKEFFSSLTTGTISTYLIGSGFVGWLVHEILSAKDAVLQTLREPASTGLVLVLVLVVLFLYHRAKKYSRSEIVTKDSYEFSEKVKLSVGDYQNVKMKTGNSFKIQLEDISQEEVPRQTMPGAIPSVEKTAAISFNLIDDLLKHGKCVKYLEVEYSVSNDKKTFIMPVHNVNFDEEDDSVFFFKVIEPKGKLLFFRCFVEHINIVKKEAEVSIYLQQA